MEDGPLGHGERMFPRRAVVVVASAPARHHSYVESALFVLAVVVAVAFVAGASRRLGWSAPLVLVVVGVAASAVPGVPSVELDPELVLFGLLPPLLYAAAIRTSWTSRRPRSRSCCCRWCSWRSRPWRSG